MRAKTDRRCARELKKRVAQTATFFKEWANYVYKEWKISVTFSDLQSQGNYYILKKSVARVWMLKFV